MTEAEIQKLAAAALTIPGNTKTIEDITSNLRINIAKATADDLEPEAIIRSPKAPGDIKVGDYVFASRWGDCDPGDPWAVGFVSEVGFYEDRRVYPGYVCVQDGERRWFHAMRITDEQGRRICAQYPAMEQMPMDHLAIARVFLGV